MVKQEPKNRKPEWGITTVISESMRDDLADIRAAFGGTNKDHLDELAGEAVRKRADEARAVLAKRYAKRKGS